MKAVLIGCGNISRVHLAALDAMEDVTVAAVADCIPERAETAAKAHGCRAYCDYIEMLDTERPDVVHICTPHHLHVDMACEALERGANVLCEKPCAITKESLERLRAAQTKSGRVCGVCFQNRYNAGALLAKKLLEEKTCGRLLAAAAHVLWCRGADYYSDGWHGKKAKEGGGVLVNQAVHTVDLLRFLVGADMASCTAHIANDHLQGVIEVEDTALVRMRYENGITAQLDATVAFPCNAKVLIDLICENATLRLEGAELYRIGPDGTAEKLTEQVQNATVGKDYWGGGHPALFHDFYACVRAGRPFAIDFYDGGKATEDFLRFYEAAKQPDCGK